MSRSEKPDTWMPLVVGDYLKDTTRLTTEQHGAYLLLIMSYWVQGPPSDDDEELAAIAKMDAKTWRKTRAKLERFFIVENGQWKHKRVEEELARWVEKKALYVARASAGGRAKAAKSTASSTPQAAIKQPKTPEKSCLKAAPQPTPSKVEATYIASTLTTDDPSEARHEGASTVCPFPTEEPRPIPTIDPARKAEADAALLALAAARKPSRDQSHRMKRAEVEILPCTLREGG